MRFAKIPSVTTVTRVAAVRSSGVNSRVMAAASHVAANNALTAARDVDNGNVLIVNPETCNRGPYTEFCGYFYAGRSVVIN